ncbi:MAG: hypothetical protein JWR69_3411 [Pedosphaera sp.]|nr:hypothetical protein [Pedosphaera sp.]
MNRFLKINFYSVAALLLLAVGTSVRAATPLNTNTPVEFFMSVADNLLQSQRGLSVTNIPVYPTNAYTPSVHRLLQLAANICDAANTNYFPSVFRPVFTNAPGTNISIIGYVEEGSNSVAYLSPPLSLPEEAGSVGSNTTNIYGIPWVIGVKKGFPNFNELAMTSVGQITRRLQVDKHIYNAPRSTWSISEMYQIGFSNVIGVELWNSYTNAYPGQVQIIVADHLNMALFVTNAGNPNPVFTTNLASSFVVGTNYLVPANAWPGTLNSSSPSALSFQTCRSNVVFLPDSVYRQNPPGLTAAASFQPISMFPPHFVLNTTNRFRCILRDSDSGRIIDYVQLGSLKSIRDLTEEARANDPFSVWAANIVNYNSVQIPASVKAQLQIAQGLGLGDAWDKAQIGASQGNAKAQAIDFFNRFWNGDPNNTNTFAPVPFSPTAKFYASSSWQVNDPLVHYTLGDLATSYIPNNLPQLVDLTQVSSFINNITKNIGLVNASYHPWNYNRNQASDPGFTDPAFKDSPVTSSDAWDFPAGLPLSPVWLGRVHRGTPWQTVYLKSASVNASLWQTWSGNPSARDALLTQPTNDWHLVSLLASLLNTNRPRDLLPVNQLNPATFGYTFSNGIPVLTNTAPYTFASLLMDSNSPQTSVILDGINAVRLQKPGQYFRDVGDILAAPELTMNSPWLNPNGGGITDLAYEMIPSQILGSLRIDSFGTLRQSNGQLQLQFTGLDLYQYEVQTSTNLQDWSSLGTASPTNGVFTIPDPAGTSLGRRYYRSAIAP